MGPTFCPKIALHIPYIFRKEPYMFQKELYKLCKTAMGCTTFLTCIFMVFGLPLVSFKEPYAFWKAHENYTYSRKSPIYSRKSPINSKKSPVYGNMLLSVGGVVTKDPYALQIELSIF